MDIVVKMPDGTQVPSGPNPVVIIGPNGVGKTRLGVAIAKANDAERIAALRNVEIGAIPMQRFKDASDGVRNALQQVMNEHWRQSLELQNLLAEILVEDRECAVKFRDQVMKDKNAQPDEILTNTRLRRIVDIWNRHFPGRQIAIDYDPLVQRVVAGNEVSYSIAQMSEGERMALYLAARVVSCSKQILVVDEPETFFHPLLARSLWNDLEEAAPTIRFVYITHDIPFALSRPRPQFAIARSESTAELLPATSGIPPDVVAQVLGAASFSVSASRLIFCEGRPEGIDNPILSAWHDCAKTAVVPVGGCEAVRECVSVFNAGAVTTGITAFGYIDRDGWPDSFLSSEPNVRAHPVSEIEGYLCLEPVFKALGRYHGLDDAELALRYQQYLARARNVYNANTIMLNKEILGRSKKRVEIEQRALLNPIKPDTNLATLRGAFSAVTPAGGWANYLATVFDEEEKRMVASLSGTADEFVRDFPAKTYYNFAVEALDLKPDAVVRSIALALKLSEKEAVSNQKLKALRDSNLRAEELVAPDYEMKY